MKYRLYMYTNENKPYLCCDDEFTSFQMAAEKGFALSNYDWPVGRFIMIHKEINGRSSPEAEIRYSAGKWGVVGGAV